MLGVAASRRGRLEEAERAYRRVVELQPESPAGYAGLASIYHLRKQLPEAEENYLTAVRLGAGPDTRVNLGQLYFETGRYREAVDVFERLVQDVPGRDTYWRILGDAYRDLGTLDRAREAYRQAVTAGEQELKVNARDPRTLSSLAVSEAKLGLADRARQHVQLAVDLSPKVNDILYRASVVSILLGDADSALAYLRQAIDAGYPAQRAAEDKDLAPLRSLSDYKKVVTPGV